jgi:hypothetical protein
MEAVFKVILFGSYAEVNEFQTNQTFVRLLEF